MKFFYENDLFPNYWSLQALSRYREFRELKPGQTMERTGDSFA